MVINRNEETTLDIGDLTVAEAQYGTVLFSLSPSDAKLYIDGSEVDPSQPITLEYGIHQIIAKADNNSSLTQYIRVAQESAGLDVVLDAIEDEDEAEDVVQEVLLKNTLMVLKKEEWCAPLLLIGYELTGWSWCQPSCPACPMRPACT